jgi:hypothetical protein
MGKEQETETPSGEEIQESDTIYKGVDSPFGKSRILPSFYYCSNHGEILAQDIRRWDEEQRPHCPRCDKLLTRNPSATMTER